MAGEAMRPEDNFTTTVDAAAAFEWLHGEETWDDRPTLAQLQREDYEAGER